MMVSQSLSRGSNLPSRSSNTAISAAVPGLRLPTTPSYPMIFAATAAVRDSAVAIGSVLGLLYIFPIVVAFLGGDPRWQHRLEAWTPMSAGLTIQDTTGLHGLPISPWGGLGVLALWALAALLAGGALLRRRDA